MASTFDLHRALRHDDRRRDAEELRGQGDALGVVAGGEGDHAAAALGFGDLQQGVHRAADLERAGALEVLALEPHLDPDPFRERTGSVRRGVRWTYGPIRAGCGPDVIEREAGEARQHTDI